MLSFAPSEDPGVLRRLRAAAQKLVAAEDPEAIATVASLPCREAGCPPYETFVQVLSASMPLSFRLKKRPAEVSDVELAQALRFARAGAALAGQSADAADLPRPPLPRPPASFKRTVDEGIGVAALRGVVREVVARTPATDVHTHLFPPSHGDLCAFGIDALLTSESGSTCDGVGRL